MAYTPTSPTGRYYNWVAIIARARGVEPLWVLAASDVPATAVYQVRQRRHPALRGTAGALQAELRNKHTTEEGQKRGDLYVRWSTPEVYP